MNAGGATGSVGERVLWVRGYTRYGDPFTFSREGCGFRYRASRLAGTVVTQAAFRLVPGGDGLRGRVHEIFAKKKASQPLSAKTCGCMFKNPSLPNGESAGFLLDRTGMKGRTVGGARISPLHANFVENRGDATFTDVYALLTEGFRRVRDRFGVLLELEV